MYSRNTVYAEINFAENKFERILWFLLMQVEYVVFLSFRGLKFHAQQAYSEIHKFYIPQNSIYYIEMRSHDAMMTSLFLQQLRSIIFNMTEF